MKTFMLKKVIIVNSMITDDGLVIGYKLDESDSDVQYDLVKQSELGIVAKMLGTTVRALLGEI